MKKKYEKFLLCIITYNKDVLTESTEFGSEDLDSKLKFNPDWIN